MIYVMRVRDSVEQVNCQ